MRICIHRHLGDYVENLWGKRYEIAVLNPEGTKPKLDATLGSLSTDRQTVYLDFNDSTLHSMLVLQGTFTKIGS
jgi:hypothetical protein